MAKRNKVQGMGPLETPDPMKTSERQAAIQANMERCPRFERCNRNQCPLDAELELRYGGTECLWMQEGDGRPMKTGAVTREYVRGAQMPDDLLRHVPEQNAERLNTRSYLRWWQFHPGAVAKFQRERAKRYPHTGECGAGGEFPTGDVSPVGRGGTQCER